MATVATNATAPAPSFQSAESTKMMQDYCKKVLSENASVHGELDEAITEAILLMHDPATSAERLQALSTQIDAAVNQAAEPMSKISALVSLAFFNSNYTARDDTEGFAKSIGEEITDSDLFKSCNNIMTKAGIRTQVYQIGTSEPGRGDLGKPVEHINLIFPAGVESSEDGRKAVQSEVDDSCGDNVAWSVTVVSQDEYHPYLPMGVDDKMGPNESKAELQLAARDT